MIEAQHPGSDGAVDCITLTTGSVAEFYIEPMLQCIGDIDVMCHHSTELAIPLGHPPPTQLPDEFQNYVKVLEIIDSHLPDLLTKCVDEGKYNAAMYDRWRWYLQNKWRIGDEPIHGPAVHIRSRLGFSYDVVYSVRCLVWPPQAADWPTRHRNYGWPDSATVDRIVSNGCNVVPVSHRLCRPHKWVGKHQWRLSFSRAEIVLINSWTPVQQIVYHMLRVFMKTERLTDSADNSEAKTLSNYHIKTLMLWACELKSQTWRTDELNLVRICVQLLHILGDWLTDSLCQHHFVNNCNLIDNSFNMTNIGDQLLSVNVTWLSEWFVDNYIRKCSQICPDNISQLFDDVSTYAKLKDAASSVVVWRLNNTIFDLWRVLHLMQFAIPEYWTEFDLTSRSCVCWMTRLAKIDSHLQFMHCLIRAYWTVCDLTALSCVYEMTWLHEKMYSHFFVYFRAVAFLHVAYKSSMYGLNDELMDVLATLLGQFVCKRYYSTNIASLLSLGQAAMLMKVVANNSHSTVRLIVIELSKAYLFRELRYVDSYSDSTYCLANVYLAVLYYIAEQYQTAIDHCTSAMKLQDHSQRSSHVVRGEILPKIDDDVDNMLGLAVLYRHIRVAALSAPVCQSSDDGTICILFAYQMAFRQILLPNFTNLIS